MRSAVRSLRAPMIFAALLVTAGIGYASYSVGATTLASGSSATFAIVFTGFSDGPGAPPNVVLTIETSLPTSSALISIGPLTGGQHVEINYTIEDVGTISAHNVFEVIAETMTTCDGDLSLAQYGPAPTTLAPLTPVTAAMMLTDHAAPGPVPAGCPDPFQASWTLTVTGSPV